MKGQIYKIHSDFYYVDSYECKLREVLKKKKIKVCVGDWVEFEPKNEEQGVIDVVMPRKNLINRPNCSNVDQILIVSSLKNPDLNFFQLDRYIALCEYNGVKPVLCFNKNDLSEEKLKNEVIDVYKNTNYKMVFTCALSGFGLDELKKILFDKTTAVCGSSGVGKSSLINAICKNVKLRTQEISSKNNRGIHTTRHCEIIKEEGFKIIDTPGFSRLVFDFLKPVCVAPLFIEFQEYIQDCKYRDCIHLNEAGCNLLKNKDEVAYSRYQSYKEIIKEAYEYKQKITYNGNKKEETTKKINNKDIAKIGSKKREKARNTRKVQDNNETRL